jgi:hypothetical protein
MRVESPRSMHNGGWFHALSDGAGCFYHRSRSGPAEYKNKAVPVSSAQLSSMITRWRREKAGELEPYAATLGVGRQDLDDLHVCWAPEYQAFAFPMCNADGEIVGIRLRNDVHKWSVRGGHQGLFIPFAAVGRFPLTTVMLVEGPTDTAAGLALGFFTIGKPNNLVGNEMVVAVLKQLPVKDVIVCYDNDEHIDSMGRLIRPGPFGAERLIRYLKCRVTRFVPPTKDLRSFLTSGGTRELLHSYTSTTIRT